VRISATTGGVTTTYVWDRESGLPLLLDDGTTAYLHADGLQSQVGAGSAASYPLADALGSVRAMTDGAGAVTGTADYAVFGAPRGATGTLGSFGFTGEQSDAVSALTYLRARYYNPALGRFLSADTVQPNASGTQGYNRYAYAANNPATLTDPSGHAALALPLTTGIIEVDAVVLAVMGMMVSTYMAATATNGTLRVLGTELAIAFGSIAMLAVWNLQLSLALPGVGKLVSIVLGVLLLIAIAKFTVLVGLALQIGLEGWEYFRDGTIPMDVPFLLDPTAVRDAASNYPESPQDCTQAAMEEVVEEAVWGILLGPAGPIDLAAAGLFGYAMCATGGGGAGDPPDGNPTGWTLGPNDDD
jgi:RHS repeat-associated protein